MDDTEKPRTPTVSVARPQNDFINNEPSIISQESAKRLRDVRFGAAAPRPRIFMSYRRQETQYPANAMYKRLVEHFGNGQVFMDVTIQPGDDFVKKITDEINFSNALLALIGDRWLTITNSEGNRRIDDPGDFVRREIEAAFARKIPVIPVLFDGAKMPRDADLPTSIARLAYHQAQKVSPDRFDLDLDQLLKVLDRILSSAAD